MAMAGRGNTWLHAVCFVGGLALASCTLGDVVSDILEYEVESDLLNGQKAKGGSRASEKKRAAEGERLKEEGVCPTCKGQGKTPDGRFTCPTCNGTGKYEVTQQ